MTHQEIIAAAEALAWLSDQAAQASQDQDDMTHMSATLMLARSYLTEYVSHVQRGMQPHDALVTNARGDLKVC